jgi:hypothetical protein
LPAYAPELNPAEGLWANLKGVELANFASDQVAEVADQAQHGIKRVCYSAQLVWSFLDHTGLSLDHDPPSLQPANLDKSQPSAGSGKLHRRSQPQRHRGRLHGLVDHRQ